MPPDIQAFKAIAQTYALRVVERNGALHGDGIVGSFLHYGVRSVLGGVDRVLGSSLGGPSGTEIGENNNVVASFNEALLEAYGQDLAGALLLPQDGSRLSSWRIDEVLRAAEARRLEVLAYAARHPDDEGAVARALDHLMLDIHARLPDEPQFRLLDGPIRAGLKDILALVHDLDRSPDKHLLVELGEALGTQLNDYLLRGLGGYLEREQLLGQSLTAVLDELGGDAGPHRALARLEAEVPGLKPHLDQEVRNFTENIGTLLTRVQADMVAIHDRFFDGDSPPTGLRWLRITDSDPHQGGKRVCILEFDNGGRLVYKPRDVRIDEAITGRAPRSGQPSLMERVSQRLCGDRQALPTYAFLPCNDRLGLHYGYVECLSTGKAHDHLVTPEGARDFYRELGVAAAVMLLAGCTDLHHGNMMVSGGRPHFTDLEFAFDAQVLTQLAAALSAPLDQLDRPLLGGILDTMMLNLALAGTVDVHHDGRPPWYVEEDRLLRHASSEQVFDVTESLLVTYLDGQLVNSHEENELIWRHQDDFASGFCAVLGVVRDLGGDYQAFVDDCSSFQVRYHPLNTSTQRGLIGDYKNHMGDHDRGEAYTWEQLGQKLQGQDVKLQEDIFSSYKRHDIPYYTREVGSTTLRDGHRPLGEGDGFFEQPAHLPAHEVAARLTALDDERIDRMRGPVAKWMDGLWFSRGAQPQQQHRELMRRIKATLQ